MTTGKKFTSNSGHRFMQKLSKSLIALASIAILGSSPTFAEPVPSKEDTAAPVKAISSFALKMHQGLSQKEKGNLFYSPMSVHTIMTVAQNGAAGSTLEQLVRALDLSVATDNNQSAYQMLLARINSPLVLKDGTKAYTLNIANALWRQTGFSFNEEFLSDSEKKFCSEIEPLEFAKPDLAADTINNWVEEKTNHKIKKLISSEDIALTTRLILTNAIYFKGSWEKKFKKSATIKQPFKIADGLQSDAWMMHQTERFKYFENDSIQLLSLPYQGGELSMNIILPKDSSSINQLEQSLTSSQLSDWQIQAQAERVEVSFPKFKFSQRFNLNDLFLGLGATDAFSPGLANFSRMTAEQQLYIAKIIHATFIDVNEEETEAAAATAVVMRANGALMAPQVTKTFCADHPFLFTISHNPTGAILFMGRIMDPTATDN